MMPDFSNLVFRGKLKKADWLANWRLLRLARQLTANARPKEGVPPVIFFNASTRLVGISLNAAFATLAASGLQVAGVPVIYFGCQAGMSRCVLGTDGDEPANYPPAGHALLRLAGCFLTRRPSGSPIRRIVHWQQFWTG
jgi:hypothetical protein